MTRASDTARFIGAGGTLADGDLAFADGHGISFAATGDNSAQSSSMATELFDDYEEGTWTPSYSITSGVGDLSFSAQAGRYAKIGNVATVWFYMVAGESSASGDVRINLPFTSLNASNYFAVASLTKTGWANVTGDIEGRVSANATIINLVVVNNGNESANVGNGNTDGAFTLYGTLTYKVA